MLTKKRPNEMFSQKTHVKKEVPCLLKSKWFEYLFQAPGLSKVKGVAFALSKNM